MLFVDPTRYKRSGLSLTRREFLIRMVPLAGFVQQQTMGKAMVTGKQTTVGVYASLIAAHIIFKSEWGEHPVARTLWNSIPANNLALIEAHRYWKKLKILHGEKEYRGYKNWREFAIDFSDDLAWHPEYYDVLLENNLVQQIEKMSLREGVPKDYCANIALIIRDYGLREFDFCD